MKEEVSGEYLIKELLANPDTFNKQGKAYQLLEYYFDGMALETLRPLLKHSNGAVRRAAIFIAEVYMEDRS